MMKRREFTDRKEAGKFFYNINKMSTVAYKSLNAKTKTYVVEWIWDKEYFKKNKKAVTQKDIPQTKKIKK